MAPFLLVDLARRGLTVTLAGDRLAVQPRTALTDADRAAIRSARAELMTYLSRPAVTGWDVAAAAALTADADALVERLGVPAAHPDLRQLAEAAAGAVARRDLPALADTVRSFERVALELAAGAGLPRTP